ncbi:DNA-binding response regulator [Actinoplanes sp. ATCC 53533]|uniref:response regulator transcription factor n=1 Tax=Actinoplanes sp. ATCC 53533 TaxID=1288362 RepID=UPI000F7A6DBF|nr:response regulator transcription factor [Actinoplanes sp. ATCC 53533]RSM70878.1 DNA-binding response regulator [Actinoplanes sp. ATCC 53533]
MRILLVEDDDTIAIPLIDGLGRYGFVVERARTGREALSWPDAEMILLDLGLPDADGIDICQRIRARSAVPIIMLTARGTEVDRVVGLEVGADDYLAKPFGLRELVARIRAVTRRTRVSGFPDAQPAAPAAPAPAPADAAMIRVEELLIDRRTRRVWLHAREIVLALKEFDLLVALAVDPGAVRTRERIMETVWDEHYYGSTKTLDFHVAALRRKLGDPAWVQTVRGVGFRLVVPDADAASLAGAVSSGGRPA